MYLPREVRKEGEEGEERRTPLLIPTLIIEGSNVNCSHHQAIPEGLVSYMVLVLYNSVVDWL